MCSLFWLLRSQRLECVSDRFLFWQESFMIQRLTWKVCRCDSNLGEQCPGCTVSRRVVKLHGRRGCLKRRFSEDFDEGGEPEQKRVSGKRLIVFVAIIALVLIGGGAGAALFLFGVRRRRRKRWWRVKPVRRRRSILDPPFLDLPDQIVNLNTTGRNSTFLKIKVALELSNSADADRINEVIPRIIDNFQVYLRELRVDDLNGSAGLYRLREELLRRVNPRARPAQVQDVLFKEPLLVQ